MNLIDCDSSVDCTTDCFKSGEGEVLYSSSFDDRLWIESWDSMLVERSFMLVFGWEGLLITY